MLRKKKTRVIIDTNLFISFLIGKRLKGLKLSLISSDVELVFAEQNISELQIVTKRDKFRKYFSLSEVNNLIEFIRIIGKVYNIQNAVNVCRDPKDDFLLELSKKSKTNYLVTGDNDLLELKKYFNTKIITIIEFERILKVSVKT